MQQSMASLIESYPWTFWLLERGLCSLLMLLLLWCMRSCWRTARANQKLALGDACDYAHAERRGLLLPLGPPSSRPRY